MKPWPRHALAQLAWTSAIPGSSMTYFQHGMTFSRNSWHHRLIHFHPALFLSGEQGWPLCKDLPAVLFLDADLNVQPHHCVCWDFLWITNSGQSYFQLLLSSPENRIFCWRIFFGFLHYDEKQRPTDQRWSCSSQRCQIKGSLLIKGIGLWINFILRAMNIYNKIFVQSSFVPVCVCVMGERITVVSTLKKAEKLIWMRCRKKNNKTKGTSVENHLCLTRGLHTLFDQEQ